MGEEIVIPLPEGPLPAWLARPARSPAGVVVLLHEIFGANRAMRAIASGMAALGHIALVPDLYARQAPGTALEPDAGMPAWERAMALLRDFDEAAALRELAGVLAFARGLAGGTGRVAAVGYCLGGRLAARLATEATPDAAVSYYGIGLDALLEPRPVLRAPLLLHLAGRDRFVPPAAQRRILAAVEGRPEVEVLVHPAADHAFARAGARSFDASAAAVAQARTQAFLARTPFNSPSQSPPAG
jgi:carboxymethylenebutenolidase